MISEIAAKLQLMGAVDVDAFVDLFLKGDSLERFFVHVCQGVQGNVADPITKSICTFITSPIQITLTQVGVVPFKAIPNVVYPYRLMTMEQKSYLRNIVTEGHDSVTGLVASLQIGGGCMLCRSIGVADVKLQAADVLRAFCNCVFHSTVHTDQLVRRGVCNLVLQRVGGSLHLNRATMQEVSEFITRGIC